MRDIHFQRESLRAADTVMPYDTAGRGGRSTRTHGGTVDLSLDGANGVALRLS